MLFHIALTKALFVSQTTLTFHDFPQNSLVALYAITMENEWRPLAPMPQLLLNVLDSLLNAHSGCIIVTVKIAPCCSPLLKVKVKVVWGCVAV